MAKEVAEKGKEVICQNRRAFHHYSVGERFEAGLALTGTEVKSCREKKAHLNDSYVHIHNAEAFLLNSHIAEYAKGNHFNHEPTRTRKLLLHRREINKLEAEIQHKGKVVVPLSLYFRNGKIKVELGVGKGKTFEDRRADIKERDTRRDVERALRSRRR